MQTVALFGVWAIYSYAGERGYRVADTTTGTEFKRGVTIGRALAFARIMHKADILDQKQTYGNVIDDGVVWGSI
jgi:hypothetical protein